MTILSRVDFVSQFQFKAFTGGMSVPALSGDGFQMLSPEWGSPELHALAKLNRAIRSEAGSQPIVRVHNSTKTVLGDHGHYVECLFHYLGDDGKVDRSIDLTGPGDMARSKYSTQTVIRYAEHSPEKDAGCSVSKSLGGEYNSEKPGKFRFEDQWMNIRLAGPLLREIMADIGFGPSSLGELAERFSMMVYVNGGIQDYDIGGFYLPGRGRGERRPFSLDRLPRASADEHQVITVVDAFKGEPRLQLSFSERGDIEKEALVSIQIASGGPNRGIRLRGWLCEIAQSILTAFR